MTYNYAAAAALLIVGVAFFATGNVPLGAVFVAVGATFIAIGAQAQRNSQD
jgi:hypothetical protein